MRILGIDYGSKRVGLAMSDPTATFAQPYSVVKNSKNLVEDIQEVVLKEGISAIVLGESKDFKGNDNVVMSAIRDFKKELENTVVSGALATSSKIAVIFEPEFLSSHQAAYFQGKHSLLDASAAAIILQSYLDRKNSQNNKNN